MSTARTFGELLTTPASALASAAESRRFVVPLLASTAAALALALVLVPRLDLERPAEERLDKDPQTEQAMSPHDREVALARARRLGGVYAYAGALFTPALRALAAALFLSLAFRVAGAKPAFAATFAVASWGFVPLAVKDLLSIPALMRQHGLSPAEAERVLPSSLAALLPPGAPAPLAGIAGALDLFAIWSLALFVLGMAQAASVNRARAAGVVLVLWCSHVLLARVALPGFVGAR